MNITTFDVVQYVNIVLFCCLFCLLFLEMADDQVPIFFRLVVLIGCVGGEKTVPEDVIILLEEDNNLGCSVSRDGHRR